MMGAYHSERIIKIGADSAQSPRLSVLVPFYRDNPAPLMRALARTCAVNIELILINDGGGSAELLSRVIAAAERLAFQTTIIVSDRNQGRARARNRLIAEARGAYVLFMDADMIPAHDDFVDRWLDFIAAEHPAVAFGGFSVERDVRRQMRVHRRLSEAGECLPARERARDPAQFTATSNLLVRRDVLAAIPFDADFVGWGWEDVDWALRAAERAHILHIDNPAVHTGLDSVETLIAKFTEAGPNYARLARKHPHAVRRFRSYRAARTLRTLPGASRVKPVLAWLARDPLGVTPLHARCAALRLYRAAIYAEHLP